MKSEVSSYSELRQLLTRTRDESGLPPHDLPTALAALIYLRWADFQEAELEAVAAFDETDYSPVLPAGLHWRTWHGFPTQELQLFFDEQLSPTLEGLNNSRHNGLATHLHRIAPAVRKLARLSPHALTALTDWLADRPFETPADRKAMLEVFDAVLDKTHDTHGGEFRTPAAVIRLMVSLAAPAASDRVYDPCFGAAGLLTAACEYTRRNAKDRISRTGAPPLEVSGVELNQDAYLIGLTRLALAGIDDPQLELGNSLERPASSNPQREGFDVVLADPPWGRRAEPARLNHFAVKTPDVAGLFIQHALSQLRPEGRAVMVVPQGFLFRGGPEQRLRQWLMEHHDVEAVVALPETSFLPYTAIRAGLLVLRRNGPTTRIRMGDAEQLFASGRGTRPATLQEDRAEEFSRSLRSPDPAPYGWDVEVASLADVEWDFTPKRRDRSELDRLLDALQNKVEIYALQKICHVMVGRSVRSENIFKNKGDAVPMMAPRRYSTYAGKREDHKEFVVAPRESLITEDEIHEDSASLEKLIHYALDRHLFITWDAANRVLFEDPFRFSKAPDIIRQVHSCVPGADALLVNYEGAYPHRTPVERHLQWLADRGYVIGDHEEWIPYIRTGDIQQGWVNKTSAWISSGGDVRFDPKWKLKTGDVVLSKSGTIGKAGIVRNGGVGAIAASGLVILRPDQNRLDPHFLLTYLESKVVHEWFDDRSRGGTTRHLTVRTIGKMLIPIPPIQVQRHVAERCRDTGVDATTFLVRVLTEGEGDPVAEWVDEALRFLKSEKSADLETADVTALMHSKAFGSRFADIRNGLAHRDKGHHPLDSWVIGFTEAADVLRSTEEVPHGPAYYSLLQQAAHELHRAEGHIPGHLPTETSARDLTQSIADRVEKAMAALAGDVQLTITCDVDTLPPGDPATVDIVIKNQGALPLRDVHMSTHPDWGGAKVGYLAEQGDRRITISGITPKHTGYFSLRLAWTVRAFDGRPVEGHNEVAFNLIAPETVEGADVPGLGGSPYVTANPVTPERSDVFFGREELLDQIRRQVIQTGNVVLLEGNRRAGKSSILWHLAGARAVPGWLGVYCSLQGAEGSRQGVGVPTVEVFREMAKSVAKAIQALGGDTPLPRGFTLAAKEKLGISKACRDGIGEEAPFSDFREYIETVLEWLEYHGLGLLLMLDEFDKLQEGIDSGVTSPQVPENIRFLVQTYPRFSAILTGGRRLKRLREEYWSALYGIGTRFGVSSLPEPAARRLVIEPVHGRLTYTTDAVDRIIHLTAGQPYLLQCLCNRIFDMAARLKIRSVTLDLVNRAGDALVVDNEHFASLWDYVETDLRRCVLTLCHEEASGPDPLQLGMIRDHLLRRGIEMDYEPLIGDLEFLRELELVKLVGSITGGRYMLAIPLMGIWIERQQDSAVVLRRARLEMED